MSYTSVGLEAHSANISNAALITKEKSTIIVRSNKEKLWKKFLKDTMQLSMIYNSLKTIPAPNVSDDSILYTLPNTYDYDYTIEFPSYSEQSFEERMDVVIKGMGGNVMDYEMGIDRLYKEELTEQEKMELVDKLDPQVTIEEEQDIEVQEPIEQEEEVETEQEE